ncbi:hypothetical protein MPTA5024_29235, partial [Microbispora sp. ATCC PTA-5024]
LAATAVLAAAGQADRRVTAIALAAGAVAALGVICEVGGLPLAARVIVESVAAGGVVLCGVQVTFTGDWWDGPVTVMWLVGATNAFCLLDRVRGALTPVAAVTAAFLAGTALVLGDPGPAALLAALCGGCLGFAVQRGTGARMGAPGALFSGFVLAAGATALTAGRDAGTIAAGLLLPAFVAIVGAGAYGTRRLSRAGLGPRTVAAVLTALSAVTGTAGLAVALGVLPAGAATAACALGGAALVATWRAAGARRGPAGSPVPTLVRRG